MNSTHFLQLNKSYAQHKNKVTRYYQSLAIEHTDQNKFFLKQFDANIMSLLRKPKKTNNALHM